MADEPHSVAVTVSWASGPGRVTETALLLAPGSVVRDALQAAVMPGLPKALAGADVGIWGHSVALDTVLRAGDRVEIYRALVVDPKVARRERFRQQGARATGLFATRPAIAAASEPSLPESDG